MTRLLRQPLAVEIDARPREFFEHVLAALDPAWLSPPGFWERETPVGNIISTVCVKSLATLQ